MRKIKTTTWLRPMLSTTSFFRTPPAVGSTNGSFIDGTIATAGYLPGPLSAIGIALAMSVAIAIFTRTRKQGHYDHIPGPINKTNFGYLPDVHGATSLDYHYTMCEKYGHVARLRGGLFGLQADGLYITDPAALNAILVRNQYNFREAVAFSGVFGVIHRGENLATVHGADHKKQRRLLNPVFTASFVSKLSPVFYKIADQLRDKLKEDIGDSKDGRVLDILDYLTRTALELISQGGLGHSFKSFDKNSREFTEFHEALKTVLPMAGRMFFVLPYLESWRKMEPVWLRRLLSGTVAYLPWPAARKFKWGIDIMHPVFAKVFKEKKKILEEGGMAELEKMASGGRDLTTLLLNANQLAEDDDRMPDQVVISNMSSIVLGGQETTSGALSRLLCLMANNNDIQNRLRKELLDARAAKGNEAFDYNALNELPLLDAVCREVLRLFAPVTTVWRQTIEDCSVPLHFPVRDPKTGLETKELLIRKGTSVYIGLGAANRSAAIWGPDVNELKPERWFNKALVDSTANGIKMPGIFSNTMTFLGGGRACPGMKFALLEMKLVLSVILPHFSFEAVTEEIEWRLGITLVPHVKGKVSEGPQVPMRVKAI